MCFRWYQESANRNMAEELLRLRDVGEFVIRGCQSSPGDFSISVKSVPFISFFDPVFPIDFCYCCKKVSGYANARMRSVLCRNFLFIGKLNMKKKCVSAHLIFMFVEVLLWTLSPFLLSPLLSPVLILTKLLFYYSKNPSCSSFLTQPTAPTLYHTHFWFHFVQAWRVPASCTCRLYHSEV